jgi:hypothetical protein
MTHAFTSSLWLQSSRTLTHTYLNFISSVIEDIHVIFWQQSWKLETSIVKAWQRDTICGWLSH